MILKLIKTNISMLRNILIGSCILFISCEKMDFPKPERDRNKISFEEGIERKAGEHFYLPYAYNPKERETFPWEEGVVFDLVKITKEFFRCKGSTLNPEIIDENNKEHFKYLGDCDGSNHGLPLILGKEGVYPVLIKLLNYIQAKSKKKVVITCGHRCPVHNLYSDQSLKNRLSKHMIGAEVDFYVLGMEDDPKRVVDLIFKYYKDNPQYKGQREYQEFSRYEKETDVSIKPWFNKEVFIKLYKDKEGRDFDNRHPYPYISIQVRYDEAKKEKVLFSWEKAEKGFPRW